MRLIGFKYIYRGKQNSFTRCMTDVMLTPMTKELAKYEIKKAEVPYVWAQLVAVAGGLYDCL
jgi:hypothetical protein